MDVQLAEMNTKAKYGADGSSAADADPDWPGAQAAFEAVAPSANASLASLLPTEGSSVEEAMTTSYWGSSTSGESFVYAALAGDNDFAGWGNKARRELLTKGSAYQVVRQHVLHRLNEGVRKCVLDPSGGGAAAAGVYDWEAAYALHAGSLEGTDGSGKGASVYALGDKRCPQFGTCVPGTLIAGNNDVALKQWRAGVLALGSGDCAGARTAHSRIVSALTVPLVQGMLREAYEVDPAIHQSVGGADGLVEVAEGWAFTAAILPQLSQCNASAGALIHANTFLNAQPTPMWSGFSTVKMVAESLYPCLGITCAE
eukprot:7348550-Prymnesium_polylepis.1